MADQGFPLPGSSYKELIKIIQGYGQVGRDAVPSDVAKVVAVHETIVGGNNRFLVTIGIVQGGKKKTITSIGSELSLALQHNVEDQIAAKWRALAESSEFLTKIVAAVRIRKGMDESSLQAHIAYSAGQPKTPRALTGAGTIIEILKAAGLLKDEGGSLAASTSEPAKSLESTETSLPSPQPSQFTAMPLPTATRSVETVHVNIDVRIQCTPQDLDELGQKLRKVLEDFSHMRTEPS